MGEIKLTKWDRVWGVLLSAAAVAEMIWSKPDPHIQKAGFFLTLILFAALTVAYEFLRPKPEFENAQPLGLGDFQFPTATEGRPIPLIWGRNRVKGPNVVWYGDFAQEPITEDVKTGLFSSETITKGYTYRIGMQLAICRGEDVTLKKVYIGDDEVFSGTVSTETTFDINEPELFGGNDLGTGGVTATCEFYPGTTTQGVSTYLARFQDSGAGSTRTPRYSKTCHIVARQLSSVAASARGAYLGNSTSIKNWSFEVERYPDTFSGQSAGENKISSIDCNPINVLYEILTDDEWGLGFNSGDIDIGVGSTFLAAADLCITEGNGFSMVLDQAKSVDDVIKIIERQIDGVLYLDQRTGLWKLELARQDYDVDLIPQINVTNISEVKEYTPGAWEDTSNIVRVKFDKRDDEYKSTYAIAQDMANAITVGGGTITTSFPTPVELVYPGIKTAANAAKVAWRELKAQSYPLSKATLVVNREMWDLHIGSVVAWTDSQLGFTKVPFRVTNINFGRLQQNAIEISLVQDVFGYQAAGFGSPPATNWTPPVDTLVAIPSDEQLAFEAPRGIQNREPGFDGDYTRVKIWCAGRRQNNEARILIRQRNSSGTPSGVYYDAGTINGFMRIGSLKSDLAAGSAVPFGPLVIEADPDSQVDLEEVFDDATTVSDLGTNLSQLIMVGNEFMLVTAAATSGADVNLTGVYRGVLDSVQEAHSAADPVYLIFVAGNLTSTSFPNVRNVDIKLLPNSRSDTLAEGSATTIAVATNKRNIRPTPPANVAIDGTDYDATPSLEGSGSGLDGFRNDFTWLRRDFRLQDEVESLGTDAGTLAPDFPSANSTEYQLTLYGDPSGTNDLVYTSSWVDGSSAVQVTRTEILENMTGGALPTAMNVVIQTRHDEGSSTNIISRYNLEFEYAPTSSLTGQFALGSLAATTGSNAYTAAASGTFVVNIGTAFTTSNVQYRLNGGAWTTVIAATGTTGNIAGVTATDTLEFRHTAADGVSTMIELKNPSATSVAFGVLHD